MNRHCWYCGRKLRRRNKGGGAEDNDRTRDHVVPKIAGTFTFLVDACASCNYEKGVRSLEEFRASRWGGLFAGEQKFIGEPSFLTTVGKKIKPNMPESLTQFYGAWFEAARTLSQQLYPDHQERYFAYAPQ